MNTENHIVFIGGGSVGPVLIIYLAKFAAERNIQLEGYTFHLVDSKEFCNGGIAYGTCAPNHILNTLSSEMSPWNKEAFYKYVCRIGRDINPLKFHFRNDYKSFLLEEFQKAKDTLTDLGVTFLDHKKKAFVRVDTNKTFYVVDENNILIDEHLKHLTHEQIILTVGYGPNMNFQKLWNEPNYIHSIYPLDKVTDLLTSQKKPVRIATFGSAAGLYDFVNSSPLKPDEMQLYIFSSASNGLEIRAVETEDQLKDLPLEKLTSLPQNASFDDIAHAIQYEFSYAEEIKAGPRTWTAFSIMGVIATVLSRMDVNVAKEFRKSQLFKDIKRLGNPTTKFSNEVLASYRPTFISSDVSVEDVHTLSDGAFEITIDGKRIIVDCIINLTGHGRHNSGILQDMKQQGLASVNDKLGILSTDKTGYRLSDSGIACIGPATHFGTDGIESFAKYAAPLAKELLGFLEAQSFTLMYS